MPKIVNRLCLRPLSSAFLLYFYVLLVPPLLVFTFLVSSEISVVFFGRTLSTSDIFVWRDISMPT